MHDPRRARPAQTSLGSTPMANKAQPRNNQFLHAASQFGAITPSLGLGTWRAAISCPRETWEEGFGEPKHLKAFPMEGIRNPLHLWEHDRGGERVTCIGHMFDRPSKGRWVIVTRMYLS